MLAVAKYPQDCVDVCHARMRAQLAAYDALAASAAGTSFEPLLFANLTLALDACFAHRQRGLEGKDDNPLNEVRLLCSSILEHGGVFTVEGSIKHKPESSVLGLADGDEIRLDAERFARLCDAYFAELERRFT